MKVKAIETSKIYNLSVIDAKTNTDYIADLIGQYNGYSDNPEDGIYYNDATEEYESSIANIEYWIDVTRDIEEVERMIDNASMKLGVESEDLILTLDHYFDVDLVRLKSSVEHGIEVIMG